MQPEPDELRARLDAARAENVQLGESIKNARDEFSRQREAWINRRDEFVRLESEMEQLRRQTGERDLQIQQLQNEIARMRATRFWRMGMLYWRAHALFRSLFGSKHSP